MKKYPRGRLNAGDHGELRASFAIQDNTLIITFLGPPVTWLGLGLADVRRLRETLAKCEAELEKVMV